IISLYLVFFFSSRRLHTSSKRDWSSDVCSSDLTKTGSTPPVPPAIPAASTSPGKSGRRRTFPGSSPRPRPASLLRNWSPGRLWEIGRASCREREKTSEECLRSEERSEAEGEKES